MNQCAADTNDLLVLREEAVQPRPLAEDNVLVIVAIIGVGVVVADITSTTSTNTRATRATSTNGRRRTHGHHGAGLHADAELRFQHAAEERVSVQALEPPLLVWVAVGAV